MRVLFPDTVPELDRETVFSSALHAKLLSIRNEDVEYPYSMDHHTWRTGDQTTSAESGKADCPEALEAPALVSQMHIPAPPLSHPLSLGPQPPLDYVPCPPDPMMTPFLTPGSHNPHRRAEPDYGWSNVALSSHTPSNFGPTPPFQQLYHHPTEPSSQQPIPQALTGMAGFTSPPMDQLIFDHEPAGGLYVPTTSYSTLNPLSSHTINELPMNTVNITATPDHWLQLPSYAGPSTSSSPGIPAHYLSPSPSAIPLPSSRDISGSPTPTFSSDLDTSPRSTTTSRRPLSPSSTSSTTNTNTNNTTDLTRYGIPTTDGAWRCAHPGCSSQAIFRRGCDLRKHFNRHRKYLFCRHESCPQATYGGFSSKKDRARHEAKHNPGIGCEWPGCGRVFSRVDNMKDHVRRIHRKGEQGHILV